MKMLKISVKFIQETQQYYCNQEKYEIAIEEVKDLGLFIEVEYCTSDDVDVEKEKNEIQDFINSLNIKVSEELQMGKPEMYMRAHSIKID